MPDLEGLIKCINELSKMLHAFKREAKESVIPYDVLSGSTSFYSATSCNHVHDFFQGGH